MTLMMVKVLAMILDLLEAFLCLPRTFLIHAHLDRLNPNLGYWPTHVGRKGNCGGEVSPLLEIAMSLASSVSTARYTCVFLLEVSRSTTH